MVLVEFPYGHSVHSQEPHKSWKQAMLINPALVFPRQARPVHVYSHSSAVDVFFLYVKVSSYHFSRHLIGFPFMLEITTFWTSSLNCSVVLPLWITRVLYFLGDGHFAIAMQSSSARTHLACTWVGVVRSSMNP